MSRRAFTLVELLVVISIIVLLMALVLAFMPRREVVATRDTAGKIESYLAGAKARALRDSRPIGVRFLSNDGNQTFYAMQLLDMSSDWVPSGAGTSLDLPGWQQIANPSQNIARQNGVALQGSVQVGDKLEITDTTPSIHLITAINFTTNTMTLAATQSFSTTCTATFLPGVRTVSPASMAGIIPGRHVRCDFGASSEWVLVQTANATSFTAEFALPHSGTWIVCDEVKDAPNVSRTAPARLTNGYRYIRRPRPLMGEENFQFPKDVIIRGATGIMPTSVNIPVGMNGDFEITFSPAGTPISGMGRTILWIADTNNAAKPILVAIYATGAIRSHDVGPVGNEFSFVQDGR